MIRPFGWNEFLFILSGRAVDDRAVGRSPSSAAPIGGLLVALGRTVRRQGRAAASANGFIRLFQGTPLLMQLFLVFFGVPVLGLESTRGSPPASP